MKTLIFATGNAHKTEEVALLLKGLVQLRNLRELGFQGDLPEEQDTLDGNALQKARYVYELYGQDCFADDTGLEVEALNMEPGVYSARYAGPHSNPGANTEKLLRKLAPHENRKARFRTVIALILNGREYLFEGVVEGEILKEGRGEQGFGYDPVFLPKGHARSFAEMSLEEKNAISHRFRAIQKMKAFLETKLKAAQP